MVDQNTLPPLKLTFPSLVNNRIGAICFLIWPKGLVEKHTFSHGMTDYDLLRIKHAEYILLNRFATRVSSVTRGTSGTGVSSLHPKHRRSKN